MPIYIPNTGESALLEKMLIQSNEDFYLKLYKNDLSPVATTELSDFQEADFSGYSEKTLLRTEWQGPTIVSGEARLVYSTPQEWTVGAVGNTIYGYYVTGKSTGYLLWTERFARERIMGVGDELKITPLFNFRTQITC